jgi:DNA-binding beta-propeller fold protein YncE
VRRAPSLLAGLAALAFLALAGDVPAQTLYWTDTRWDAPLWNNAASNGTGVTSLPLAAGSLPEGVAFDETHRRLYWVEAAHVGARILRSNVDGSGVEAVITGGSAFRGVAIDEAAGKLYWTSSNQAEGARIRRANLDGTNVQVLLELGTTGANPRGIALDPAAGRMYWADLGLGSIHRANLDGTNPEVLATASAPYGVAVDPAAGFLYLSLYGLGNISRMPLAGGPLTKLKTSLTNPTSLALDPAGGMIYWIEAGGATGPRLRRSSLAVGGTIEDLVPLATYGGLAYSSRGVVSVPPSDEAVARFALGPITPNPSAGPARIAFALPQAARVRLAAFDVRGREVAVLVDAELPAGRHDVTWSGRAGAGPPVPGIYFLRLLAPGVELVQRAVILP